MPFITQGKTNWKFLLIVIILAIIICGGALWYARRPEKPYQPVEIKKPEKVVEDETVNWKIYYNPKINFTFKYPESWEIKQHRFSPTTNAEEELNIVLGKIGDTDSNNFINFDLFKKLDCSQGMCINNFQTYSKDPQILEILNKIANSKRDDKFAYWSQWCLKSGIDIDQVQSDKEKLKAFFNTLGPEWVNEVIQISEDQLTFGDLNNDGKEDLAVITYLGPFSRLVELEILLNQNGRACYLTSKVLGDRVEINSIKIQSGEIILDMITHAPGEGACCPTLKTIAKYQLSPDKSVKVEIIEGKETEDLRER